MIGTPIPNLQRVFAVNQISALTCPESVSQNDILNVPVGKSSKPNSILDFAGLLCKNIMKSA